MAEINVQRKSSSALWIIIGIIALAVILWLLFGWDTEPGVSMSPDGSMPVAAIGSLSPPLV